MHGPRSNTGAPVAAEGWPERSLEQKLGLMPGLRVAVIGAPAGFELEVRGRFAAWPRGWI